MTGTDSRYLCIHLGNDEFAIPLLLVKEVIGLPDMTPIPQAASHFSGIMNLRGKIISVMDLRVKLGMKGQSTSETTVIILDIDGHSLGVVVDKVNSVQVLSPEMMSEKPAIDSTRASEYIQGVFRRHDKIVLILDVAKALQAGKAA
ncbi:MAG: purine-binding chemotaxis protein CheW [Bdellovibrionaceae bacterium]|nr:purine-binding chemotaxis protein CheW [Pseudobdellovibrionaceae bacterium]